MTMVQRGKAVKTRVRKFKINDLDQVVAIAERYASWDLTSTEVDVEGFHSASPEFFFVAEAEKQNSRVRIWKRIESSGGNAQQMEI